jgi:hypothetical protein
MNKTNNNGFLLRLLFVCLFVCFISVVTVFLYEYIFVGEMFIRLYIFGLFSLLEDLINHLSFFYWQKISRIYVNFCEELFCKYVVYVHIHVHHVYLAKVIASCMPMN